MSGDQSVLGYEFTGRGPAQRRLLEWLQPQVDVPLDSAVAQRSPAGPWAIKLHAPNRVPTCAALLQAESWVERVAVRPQHLYVRIGCERLCEWVVEGFAGDADVGELADRGGPVGGGEGRGRSVLVRAVDVDALVAASVPRPLRLFRETAVARSVAALLRSRGFEVTLDLLSPGRETYDEVWAAAPGSVTHTVVVGSGVPAPSELERGDHVVHLPVGEIDVRHGPLRARNGGSVSADDVVAEVVRALPAERRAALGGDDAPAAIAYGEAVLALLLLATPRARRIQLSDEALRQEMETFGCLAQLVAGVAERTEAELPDGAPPPLAARASPGAGGEALRDLGAELDLLATNAARGTAALDPALVARSLRSIAERSMRLAEPGTTRVAPEVASATRSATEVAFALAGIEFAGGAGSPTPAPTGIVPGVC